MMGFAVVLPVTGVFNVDTAIVTVWRVAARFFHSVTVKESAPGTLEMTPLTYIAENVQPVGIVVLWRL